LPTDITVNRIQVGEIPGPVSLTCDEGETVWAVFFHNDELGGDQTLQLCVPDGLAPCDTGGFWDLMSAAGYLPADDPCA